MIYYLERKNGEYFLMLKVIEENRISNICLMSVFRGQNGEKEDEVVIIIMLRIFQN